MRKVLMVALMALSLTACDRNKTSAEITYSMDYRTKLCYAWHGMGNQVVMSHVPCTEEVLALISR
jgi:hypothetical protein